jgi:putative membrane protein
MKYALPLIGFALLAASTTAFAETARETDAAKTPDDAQIAQIVLTSDKGEIDASKLAKKKSSNPEVKEFAAMMIKDHTTVSKETQALAKKLKMKPKGSLSSKGLAADAKKNEAKLKSLKGADFDKAFIDQMVADHQGVLDTIDQTLLPNAQSQQLKDLISKVRPSVAEHLDHAKTLQAKLETPNAG